MLYRRYAKLPQNRSRQRAMVNLALKAEGNSKIEQTTTKLETEISFMDHVKQKRKKRGRKT